MNRLARIIRPETPSTPVQFRKTAYGKHCVQDFLRDALAMANAAMDGPRYIITGAQVDARGRRIGIQCSPQARNLRSAATGKLRLLFQ